MKLRSTVNRVSKSIQKVVDDSLESLNESSKSKLPSQSDVDESVKEADEDTDEEEETGWGNYMPHRPIYKENSTTSTRPIYDASAGSPSLNRCLEKGPNLIEQVVDILLRFREGSILA